MTVKMYSHSCVFTLNMVLGWYILRSKLQKMLKVHVVIAMPLTAFFCELL